MTPFEQRGQRKNLGRLHGEDRFDEKRVQGELGFSKSGTTIVDRLLSPPLEYDLRTRAGRALFYEGALEIGEIGLAARLLAGIEAPLIVDADAGVGIHSIEFARAVASAKVFAFEPVVENRAFLERNAARAKLEKRITIVPNALGGEHTFLDFGGTPVEIVTLDDFLRERKLEAPALIRIQASGRERAIVTGAQKTLAKQRPIVALSFTEERASLDHAEATIAELVALGYKAYVSLAGCAIPFAGYRAALRNYLFVDERRALRGEETIDPSSLLEAAAGLIALTESQAERLATLERAEAEGGGAGAQDLIAELRAANLQLEEELRQRDGDLALLLTKTPPEEREIENLRAIAREREEALEAIEEALRRIPG